MEKTYKRVIIIDHVNDNFISKGKLGAKSGEVLQVSQPRVRAGGVHPEVLTASGFLVGMSR